MPWEEGDDKLVCGVLNFSRTLVEGCGNRSLYASSAFVGDLLNTTSLDVLEQALRLGARLGQRYYTSRIRGAMNSSTNAALLASHYNINLEKVAKIASPFVRNIVTAGGISASKPIGRTTAPLLAHDLSSLARGGASPPESNLTDSGSKVKKNAPSWDEWGSISLSYYLPPTQAKPITEVATTSSAIAPITAPPVTPTPNRRATHHGIITSSSAQRRRSSTDDVPTDPFTPSIPSPSGMQTFELPYWRVKSTSVEEILKTSLPDLPPDTHYEFLQRLRVAKALVTSPETRRKILAIRILAIMNLAYVYSETTFHSRILLPDQDEPRRLQLVYQLAELVHSGDNKSVLEKDGHGEVPRRIQTLAFGALEALAKHKTKTADVCAALSVNVNHGVLLYVIRKMIAELAAPDQGKDDYDQEAEEWRDSLFSLAQYLPNTAHAGQLMAGAGIIPILCEFLQLRTCKALRNMPRAILLLDSLVYGVSYSAFQNLANSRGLDVIVDLVSDEVQAALKEVEEGRGIPDQYRSDAVDYRISNQRQQTLRALWKFMHHMMGLSGANTDHLLRNFIDSPKLLKAVKDVLVAAPVFGNAVWSATVSILSSFIHNEPTSYAIVHEAALSQALLRAVGGKVEEPTKKTDAQSQQAEGSSRYEDSAAAGSSSGEAMETETTEPTRSDQAAATSANQGKDKEKVKDSEEGPRRKILPRDHPPAQGILPAMDSMTAIPTAFGAICLNASGLALFQSSGALERFFEVFESPEHVRCMADTELSSVLGNQFDELVRHHPPLRDDVIDVIVEMCQRVIILGKRVAEETGAGAKVWMDDGKGGIIVAGGRRAMVGGNITSPSEVGSSEEVVLREQEPDGSPKGEIVYLEDVVDDDEAPADGSKQSPSIATYIDVVARFLEAFLQNSTHSKDFIKRGGLDCLLEVYSLPSLPYDFATKHANNSLSRALHILCDNNSQPALNAILKHAQKAVDGLEPLLRHSRKEGYFAPLTNQRCSVNVLPPRLQAGAPIAGDDRTAVGEDEEAERQAIENVKANGTRLVKSLVTVHSFTVLLSDIFIQPIFNIRTVMPMFQSISAHSEYESFIPRLGALHRICVWEEILMQRSIPDTWNEATKVKGGASAPANAAAEGEAAAAASSAVTSGGEVQHISSVAVSKDILKDPKEAEREVVERDGKTSYFRNVKTLRFLISQIPSSITPFLQGLAKSLFPRRSPDMFHKQHAFKIGESIADVMLQHLTWKRLETADSTTEKYGYWIVMLSSISSLLLEDRPQAQVITTTLINFKQLGGLAAVTEILETFWHEVESLPATLQEEGHLSKEDHQRMVHAYGAIKIILSMIANITSYKSVMEATQTTYLQSRERDRDRPDYFNPSQLLVELRYAVMPTIHAMWEAPFVDKASCSIVKSIIDILGIILKADGEGAAFTRKDLIRQPSLLSWRSMEPDEEKLQRIIAMGFPRQEAQSALLRSNGDPASAADFLINRRTSRTRQSQESAASSRPQTADSSAESDGGTDVDITRDESMPTLEDEVAEAPPILVAEPASSVPASEVTIPESGPAGPATEEPMPMNIDDAPAGTLAATLATVIDPGPSREPTTQEKGKTKEDSKPKSVDITVDDLNDKRKTVRDNLINRALDILQVHPDVTFELAALINNAFWKGQENSEGKKEVASTIVQSLMSLQLDEDFRPHGRTISATAHLLGLILQNQEFYEACLDDLKTQIPVLVEFIKIYPGEPAPWVANILLVVEKILAEVSQPRQVKFSPGLINQPPSPIVELTDYTISFEDTKSLFEAIMAIVPLIDRDDVLALAVTRVLAIITRHRELAVRLTETDYLHRLFHMFKRHAGLNTTRVQNCMMYILRHIIEDKETIKSVMKAEIRSWFQARGSRQIDINSYIRHTSHLVLRDPEAYVEVTNEVCKLTRYDTGLRSLSQQIAIKDPDTPKAEVEESELKEEKKEGTADAKEEQKGKEPEDKEMTDKPKPTTEMKAPGVEKPDGVIHFLLSELLHWKDLEDTETPVLAKDGDVEMKNTGAAASNGSASHESANTAPTAEPVAGDVAPIPPTAPSKPEKPEFKAEQHPIYIYRCFLIQCLTELLSCYTRSKIEFINFSRKSQPREAITPFKPRSAVLNYLLYDLIPMGSLLQQEDIAYKKKSTISNWAISAVVALASQTGESSKDEEEPELLFVRKFVLESMLKAFKDATTSGEPLDARYARILSLADLFHRMLSVRPNHGGGANSNLLSEKSQEQIARIMFEKNFIGALTNSLADIDLNFPSARRVIKYILRPLKVLSKTAVELSETSDITNLPGVTDEDEISIASSLSDIDGMREETPNLYRHSALGVLEGGEMDDDQSDYDEDDEEGVIYEDEMDYDEEEEEVESDSEISEEEDVPDEEMGVQIVLESHEHHHHHDEGSEDEDEDMSEDEMDDDEGDVEIIDELADIGGAVYENPGEDDDWQSGDSGGEGDRDEEEILVEEPVDSIIRALGVEEVHDEMDDERDDGFVDDEGEDEDEDDEDDELDEEDALMHAELDEEDEIDASTPWGWAEDPGDAPMMTRAGQPARGGWYTLGGAPRGEIDPNFRIMRLGGAGTRAAEDNSVNPLLQRSNSEQGGQRHPQRQDLATNWVEDGALATSSAVSMLNTLMSFVARAHGGAAMGNFRFTTSPALLPGMHAGGEFGPREIRAMFGNRRPQPEQPRYHREDPQTIVNSFIPTVTIGRWQEEARLIHGSTYADKAGKIVNALLVLLVPPALEEEKLRKEREEKNRQEALRLEEERKKKEEEERVAKEKAEAEEKARKEAEEREAAERAAAEVAAAAEAAHAAQVEAQEAAAAEGQPVDAMEGVEPTQQPSEGEAGPSAAQQPRAVVMIRGREMDITGMDIDPGFLEALPEELREEVLTNHIRERRAAAASTNQTSEISREFLEALPDDIRDELLAQEANERRRRERDAARSRAAANGQAPSGPVELDLASFLATLDPGLRQTVLLEQDDESLAQLPQAIIAEANALRGDRRLHQYADLPRTQRVRAEDAAKPSKKPVRKTTVQMLDKAGIATLLRLMFMPQGNTARSTLNDILLNVCENRQNRSEVLNTLLLILQEGSTDMAAVERIFAQLSIRARQTNFMKTPIKRSNTGPAPLIQSSSEISPLMVAQQCLQALHWLVNYNEHIPSYFLSEHDISTGLKRVNSKKGKGKEVTPPKSSKYALNTLLSLLDRKMITESSSLMDQLSGLLSEITRPLTILKKEKKRQEEEKANQVTATEAGPSTTGLEGTTAEGTTTANETAAVTEDQPTEGADKEEPKETKEDETPKKTRNLVPPVVPEGNLKLVVKILVARECSGKTFRETLTTMQNLSAIPGAREVFGRELIEQAKILGDLIYSHLEELVQQIHVAANGTEVQGMALSKFSPASSDQAKLLRVLTALDYLFDPKREKKDKPEEAKKDEEKKVEPEKSEAEIFSRLYDSKTFGALWGKLSDCLTAIHEREDMLHVATILLPLIEALMVVCKNSGMKEGNLRQQREKTPRFQTPPIESGMENLFFRFTEDHRKILNQMVRNNPKLMSGSFSLLVNNPKVLDFDNKRNYFNRRLHARTAHTREQPPPLQLSVRRDQVFLDSFKSMYFKSADEIKYAKLSIRFSGEEGVDAGGVTREWFQVLARQMFNPDYALFTPVASDRTTFHPNRTSWINAEHLSFFKFIGRIIGKALYEGRVLDCHFSRAVYKKMLGRNVSLKDMETLDLDYYKSLVWMLENDITDIITETFSIEANDYGDKKIIDLIPNGRNTAVTEENKQEYVRMMVEYKLLTSVQEQMEHFLKGFHDIVPADLVAIFNEQELELLISGLPDIDVDDWRNNTEYHNYSASSPQIQWFWRAVRSFDKEERAKLLQFATGTSKVPLNGFKELEGMNGFSKFNIHRDYGSKDRLPSSHTCFNRGSTSISPYFYWPLLISV
ncbi:hypothetical protein L211DRAFT_476750 [Terfezia boudieri ATCC MYA-4762]|uniref:HECT-type E3 ubiquitin transferase n=1 Tax=Terfezia boudieri ATCC MYA-4762 TaxID=1051890 RepID=A0A3N4M3P4_9PEZI|nr:hypothetical protein L211DRAFT_476750 [Terfezia boudieri ATCC MYA-4762]